MNITIVGAGNIGTQFAVHCAEKHHRVTVFGSKPDKIGKELCIVNELGELIHSGTIHCSTSDPKAAFSSAELIFITMPAYCMQDIAHKILPFANSRMKICLVPGTGGGECAFKACIEAGAILFGLQRVPSVARLIEYGKKVKATGYREELFVASLPASKVDICAELIESLFDMRCSTMPNYLNLTLTPSNPILHTTRLRTLFSDYVPGKVYERVPLFYEEWSDETSELLFACDKEVQNLCKSISAFDLSYVKSLRVHYESENPEALTRKITSIAGFKGLSSPTVKVEGGFVPDWNSRYFTADFPYGLSILVQIAEMFDVPHENMLDTLKWYEQLHSESNEFKYSEFGIMNQEQFLEFYSR